MFGTRRKRTPAPPTRQLTRKTGRIHQLWRKATSSTTNKALFLSLFTIVGSIVGLFVTSRGSIAPSLGLFRAAMLKLPGGLGKKIIYYVQMLVDLFLSAIGVGLKVGTVVTFKNSDDTLIEKGTYKTTTANTKNDKQTVKQWKQDVDDKMYIVCQATSGNDWVHLAEKPAADSADFPAPDKLKKWCSDNKKEITYGKILPTMADTEKDKNKPFRFPRLLLKKCDKDEQITKENA